MNSEIENQIKEANRLAELQEEVMREVTKALKVCNEKVPDNDRMLVYTAALSFLLVQQYPAEDSDALNYLLYGIRKAYEHVWEETSDIPIKDKKKVH